MNVEEIRKKIIENYVGAYNNFDVENMLKDLDENIIFRNIHGGAVNLTTEGVEAFEKQAAEAKKLFSRREQKITALKFVRDTVEAEIAYRATLAVDLPNGLKSGSEIELEGKSIFRFQGDRIVEIEDIS